MNMEVRGRKQSRGHKTLSVEPLRAQEGDNGGFPQSGAAGKVAGGEGARPEPALCHGLDTGSPLTVSHAEVLVYGEITGWRGQRGHRTAGQRGHQMARSPDGEGREIPRW